VAEGGATTKAVLALVLALAALALLLVSFRGLWFLTLPLAAAALVLGLLAGREATGRSRYAAAMAGVVLGGVVLVIALVGLAANVLISRDYDVYEGGALAPVDSDRL
jgi:hypothetical protein